MRCSGPEILDIEIGSKVSLDVAGLGSKLTSTFVGFVRARLVIIQLPVVAEVGKEHMYGHLFPGNEVVVRYIQSGMVIGFSSKVIQYQHAPFPLLFLSFPETLESVSLRKHKRISCHFRAVIQGPENKGMDGIVMDVSQGGCCFISDPLDTQLQGAFLPRIEDELALLCEPLGASPAKPMRSSVRRVAVREGRLELGLKFSLLDPGQKSGIEAYLSDIARLEV
jgi:c-di-GMP-binding flagellar brake protein YcgR